MLCTQHLLIINSIMSVLLLPFNMATFFPLSQTSSHVVIFFPFCNCSVYANQMQKNGKYSLLWWVAHI